MRCRPTRMPTSAAGAAVRSEEVAGAMAALFHPRLHTQDSISRCEIFYVRGEGRHGRYRNRGGTQGARSATQGEARVAGWPIAPSLATITGTAVSQYFENTALLVLVCCSYTKWTGHAGWEQYGSRWGRGVTHDTTRCAYAHVQKERQTDSTAVNAFGKIAVGHYKTILAQQ